MRCPQCKGKGWIWNYRFYPTMMSYLVFPPILPSFIKEKITCPKCKGKGEVDE